MKTVEDFWPTYNDDYVARIKLLADDIEKLPSRQLIMSALELIMEEQQRTGHRSEGWPSEEHNATRFVLHNIAHKSEKIFP